MSVRRVQTVSAILRDRSVVIAGRCRVADTMASRMVGLLGRPELSDDEGLWIVPCNSVHTWFMRFPLDLVFLDRQEKVIRVAQDLSPFRMRVARTARSVLELPAGRVESVGLAEGDAVSFVPVST